MDNINNTVDYAIKLKDKDIYITEMYYPDKLFINISENKNIGSIIKADLINSMNNIHYETKVLFGNSIYDENFEYISRILIEYLNKTKENNIYCNKNILFGFGFEKLFLNSNENVENLLIELKNNYKKIIKIN